MGFFDRLNKIWSGLDFLQGEENRGQREQFAKEDEEERRRRAREAAARSQSTTPAPGTVVQPQPKFDFSSPLTKVGSQSSFNNPVVGEVKTPAPLQKAPLPDMEFKGFSEAGQEDKKLLGINLRPVLGDYYGTRDKVKVDRNLTTNKDKYIAQFDKLDDDRKQILIDSVTEQAEKGDQASINTLKALQETNRAKVPRDFWQRGADIASTPGRSIIRVATGIGEGVAGTYDLITPGKGNNRASSFLGNVAENVDEDARAAQVEPLYKALNVGTEIASYLIPATAAAQIISKVPKAAKAAKLTTKVIDLVARYVDDAGEANKLRRFLADRMRRGWTLQQALEEGIASTKYTGENAAKGNDTSIGSVATDVGTAVGGSLLFPNKLRKAAQGDELVEEATGAATVAAADQADDIIKKVPEDVPEIPGTLDEAVDGPTTGLDDGIKVPQPPRRPNRGRRMLEPLDAPQFQQFEQAELIPQVPDVTNPIALAKADTGAPSVTTPPPTNEVPMADFREAVNGSLRKAEPAQPVLPAPEQTPTDVATAAAQGDLRVGTDVDAAGNPTLISDAEAQRQLADAGVVPQRAASPVATAEEELQAAAEQAARQEVDLSGAAAPRLREELATHIKNEDLQADVLENFNPKNGLNLEEAENRALRTVTDASDEDLVATFGRNVPSISSATEMFEANLSANRLQRLGTSEADLAVKNIVDGLTRYAEVSGQNLRSIRALYENMPTAMKQKLLIDKLEGATGAALSDAQRAELVAKIDLADEATTSLRSLEDEAAAIIDSGVISNKSTPPEVKARVRELSGEIADARRNAELRNGEAWKTYQENLPKAPLGKRVADVGRTFMLSSPAGRAFDILSTSVTTADDLATRGVSNLIGKVLNKVPGVKSGTLQDTITAPRKLFKGLKEGARRTGGGFAGKDYVEDFMGQAKRATRGDINNGGSFIRRGVRTLVEAPTNLTRGLRDEQLFREGMQEASQAGLKGDARRVYAELRASIPNEKQLYDATQTHLKANMLHDNKISKFLQNTLAKKLDEAGHGWGAVLVRNQIAPFTSWLGGNLHRTLTDKNVLWNVGSIVNNARKGNVQGVVDSFSKLAVNSVEAYAIGVGLTKAGIITTEDANGDDYAGLYINIGDRYIPVAILGTAAVPLILGNSYQQAVDAQAEGENPASTMVNTLAENIYKNTGVASVFGGENNLQTTLGKIGAGDFTEAATGYAGDLFRQYIPGITGDLNALLDQNSTLNPTGEAAETKVTQENPETGRQVTDVLATEINKTKARVPFMAQDLPRKEGTVAKDMVDRATRGTRESGEQREEKVAAKTKEEVEKDRKKRKIPETDDGIQAKVEDGDWDAAIEGYKWKIERSEEDGELSKKTRKTIEDDIKRLEITRDLNHSPEIIDRYKDVSLTEWRKMGDPEDEDYNPEEYQRLFEYDQRLTDAGVSRYEGGSTKTKYYYKDSKRGGGKGKGKKPKFATDIATQKASGYKFSPTKAQAANFEQRKSAIPLVSKVPNYSLKPKKISVSRGGRP